MTTKLTAINGSLTYNNPNIPIDLQTAAQDCMLFSQYAALSKLISDFKPGDKVDPTIYQTKDYYEEYSTFMGDTGWIVKGADVSSFKEHSVETSVKIGDLLKDVFEVAGIASGVAEGLEALITKVLDSGNTNVTDFMNFWYKHVNIKDHTSGMSMGPLMRSGDTVILPSAFYSAKENVDDWRALFISSISKSVSVYTCALQFELDLGVWNNNKTTIENKINAFSKEAIESVSF